MAATAKQKQFIEDIAGYVQEYAPQYGILCNSAVIAQAILESGWGETSLAYKYHNYFGLKCGTLWTGPSVNLSTKEEYTQGTLTTITDNFRVYDSMEAGVEGYFQFLDALPHRYGNLKGITDPQQYLETIRADGYATSYSYVTNTMACVTCYDLTQYDGSTPVKEAKQTVTKTEKATQWMINLANDDSHGYSQDNRWGPDYDCSSAVITAWETSGVPVKSKGGATYTGNMYTAFIRNGFRDVTSKVNLSTGAGCVRGDVLLNVSHHTAMYIGNGKEVEARSNENGGAHGGQTGDQTGREIMIMGYRNYPWDYVLRYEDSSGEDTPAAEKAPLTSKLNRRWPELSEGCTGVGVRILQAVIGVDVDGEFGPNTKSALIGYQQGKGLIADGVCGFKTWKKINLDARQETYL